MKVWRFEAGVEVPADDRARVGKPEWPDMVRVGLPRRDARRLAQDLLKTLLDDPGAGHVDLAMPLMGRLACVCPDCEGDGFTAATDQCDRCRGTGEVPP